MMVLRVVAKLEGDSHTLTRVWEGESRAKKSKYRTPTTNPHSPAASESTKGAERGIGPRNERNPDAGVTYGPIADDLA